MTVIAWDGTSEYSKESYRAIRIDGRRFLSTSPISVSHIMAAAGRDSTYQFFQEREDSRADALLMPTDVVTLVDGDAFYGIPPCTFAVGGSAEPVAPPPDSLLEHVRAAAWHVVKQLRETNSCGRAALESLDYSLSEADRAGVWWVARAPQGDAPPPLWNNSASIEGLYHALGQIKGINSDCERHRNAPWQLQCETCRRFVATELAFQGVREVQQENNLKDRINSLSRDVWILSRKEPSEEALVAAFYELYGRRGGYPTDARDGPERVAVQKALIAAYAIDHNLGGGASSSGSSPLRERPLSPADLPLTFGMPKEPGDDMGGQST